MDEDLEINYKRLGEVFRQRAAEWTVRHHEELIEAVVDGIQQDLHPRKRRSLVQTITIEVLRRVAATLNLRLEDLSNVQDRNAPEDAELVDAVYTVIEPEPPIAMTYAARRERYDGTTQPQKKQQRSHPAATCTRSPEGRYRVHHSGDDLRHAGNE